MRVHTTVSPVAAVVILLGLSASLEAGDSTVCLTFGGQFDQRIPADPDASKGWMDDAIVEVPLHLVIHDLDVSVSLTHTNVFDLHLYLESPSGTRVLLNAYDPFAGYFEGEDYDGTVFDDEADRPIEAASPPFRGRYRPITPSSLAVFDGEDAYGPWRFEVYDAYHLDTGCFDAFALTLTIPEPATVAFLFLGLGLIGAPQRRRG
jgi:hypothetical protein